MAKEPEPDRDLSSERFIHAPRSRVFWRMLHETAADLARFRDLGRAANEENFDRLEAELATMG